MMMSTKTFENKLELQDKLSLYLSVNYSKSNSSRVEHIIGLVNRSNYLQLLYSYGVELLNVLDSFFLSYEIYEENALINKTISDYNKSTGFNIKLYEKERDD